MADGKRRYKSDRKDHKVSVKLSEKDMDILKAALNRTGMTASAYIRELIRTGGNIDTSYPADRAKAIRIIAGIANNINQAVKLGNSQERLYYSDIDKLQNRKHSGRCWKYGDYKDLKYTGVRGQKSSIAPEECFGIYPESG